MSLKKKLREKPGVAGLLHLGSVLRSRRQVRRRLDEFASLMAPGRYSVHWNLACRENPSYQPPTPARRAFVGHNRNRHPACRLADCLPPRSRDITASHGSRDLATAADVLLTRGYATLLLTSDGNYIIRLFRDPDRARKLLDNAAHLSHWLQVPTVEPFESGVDGTFGIRESLISGTMIRHGESGDNARGYRDFLRQCMEHAHVASGRFARETEIRDALSWPFPPWLSRVLEHNADALVDILARAPMVFSHGDCHAGNLFIRENGSAALIDLERAEWMPFFFDPLYILRMQDPTCSDLRQRYFDGEFDDLLRRTWQAAGREFDPAHRLNYLLCVSIAHALRTQYRSKGVSERARKLHNSSRSLQRFCSATPNR